uniref:Uncharacterized protein n=1 Tax=Arundo donax TaxID=35708 RepID=A0A0A8XSY7_ARUDO
MSSSAGEMASSARAHVMGLPLRPRESFSLPGAWGSYGLGRIGGECRGMCLLLDRRFKNWDRIDGSSSYGDGRAERRLWRGDDDAAASTWGGVETMETTRACGCARALCSRRACVRT